VYWTGRLIAPNVLNFGRGGILFEMTMSYTLVGIFFLVHAAWSPTVRWTIIPIGSGFGLLAILLFRSPLGSYVASVIFKPRDVFVDSYPSSQWEYVASGFFINPLLGGAIAGAIILILHRGFVALKRT
jgi:hypothetical protein